MPKATIVYYSGAGRTKLVAEHVPKGLQSLPDNKGDMLPGQTLCTNI